MSYNLLYSSSFSSTGLNDYTLQIFQKDYMGFARTITGSSCVHSCDEDNPRAAIKGSKLEVGFINDGFLPISNFYSNNDDEFKAVLTCFTTGETLFVGFLVQDDCSEVMVDYNHTIKLTFTDNLGLLKDIKLDAALRVINYIITDGVFTANVGQIAPHTIQFTMPVGSPPVILAGDIIEISGTTFDGTYNINNAVPSGGSTYILTVDETVITGVVESATITIRRPYSLSEKLTLFQIITSCLTATGIELEFHVFCNMYETRQDYAFTFLSQTYINPESFKSGDDFMDCYEVLTRIFEPLRLSLMQCNGAWELKKWDEAAYQNPWAYFIYDTSFTYINKLDFDKFFTAGIGQLTVAETGLSRRIERPFQFVKEKFEYKQGIFVKNGNFSEVGSLIQSYDQTVDGQLQHVFEYQIPFWYTNNIATPNPVFIRVIQDDLFREIERYAVVVKDATAFDDYIAIQSTPIEVNKDDRVRFDVGFKLSANASITNTTYLAAVLLTTDGTFTGVNAYSVLPNGEWANSAYTGASGVPVTYDNTRLTEWQTSEGISLRMPAKGLLYVFLADLAGAWFLPAGSETHYKHFTVEILYYVNNSTQITGHTHTETQAIEIKNTSETNIYIDDSPRNSIAGTLFLDSKSDGITSDRTLLWRKYLSDSNPQTLGNIASYAVLYARHKPNTIIEGDLYKLVQNNYHLNAGAIVKYSYFPNQNFIFGRIEIDYRNDKLTCTLYELFDDTVPFASLIQEYEFRYLYSTK